MGIIELPYFFYLLFCYTFVTMKIESEKLNQIVSLRKQIGEITMEIASLEIQKHNALHKYSALQTALNKINQELTDEYGEDAQIDLSTGEVTKLSQKEQLDKIRPLKK
jgi:hypothetical protein